MHRDSEYRKQKLAEQKGVITDRATMKKELRSALLGEGQNWYLRGSLRTERN
jgi:hypothetical protein